MGRRSSQMGSQKICLLLVVLFMNLHMLAAASSPLHKKAFSSDSSEDIDQGNKHVPEHEHGTGTAKVDHYARSDIVESSKFAHGTGGAHAGGGSPGFGEHGSNGGSGTPYVQGGTTIIPIYAGGAASNHHPNTHRNAVSCNQSSTGFLTLILTAVAWFVHL
ncbi:cold and drought-regulated protein CORA-like [Pistacia vera]|uniref:cold and drought-regulated protein CORA-like n=1 Tax=Pistacia vera TaxID=55513 RepID=UPI0012632AF5|nr:cold and drought-regulated protein CORA-like [Pistacia vera]